MLKKCPQCKRSYTGREIYCTRCGVLLEKEVNACSEMKTELCTSAKLNEKDRYCPYCCSPTTYALATADGDWKIK